MAERRAFCPATKDSLRNCRWLAVRDSRIAEGMAALGLGSTRTGNSSPGRALKIHDLSCAVRLFPLARPAAKAEYSPGMFVRRMRQNRGQWNWLAAGQAADATIRLPNCFHVHIKRLLKDMYDLTKGGR